jgi:uncharacterized protein (DUF58 family)
MATAPARNTGHYLRTAADAAAAHLPPLLVAARRIAATVTLGSHGRRRSGPGESFWQFRPYSRDDTPQSIDWRQSAKTDHVFVREREWVAAQTVALWSDLSPSMHYRSHANLPTKAERAAVLTLALADLLADGGERIMHLSISGRTRAAAGRVAVAHMADTLEQALTQPPTAPATFADNFVGTLPRHTTVTLISDFLSPLEEISAGVHLLAASGVAGHLLQVLDPAEESLPFKGRVRFVGLEQEGMTVVERTEDARSTYIQRLAAQRAGLKDIATRTGWSFAVHHTDRPAQAALAMLHQAMTGHGLGHQR